MTRKSFPPESPIPEFGECFIEHDKFFKNTPSNVDVREDVDRLLLKSALEESINTLTSREKTVIEYRFFKIMTLKEVGKKIGVSQERARQIESKGIRKLRHPTRAKVLTCFLDGQDDIYEKREEERLERAAEKAVKRERKEKTKLLKKFKSKKEAERKYQLRKENRIRLEKIEEQKKKLSLWWHNQRCKVEKMMDFSIPSRCFVGKCSCKSWQAEYSISIDEYEALCCRCLEKFWMRSTTTIS